MTIFRSLSSRNFKLFVSGQSVSLIGTWMQKVAISWLVYKVTGSAFMLGLAMFASLIPSLVLSPYAGSYTDRHNRYTILLYSQLLLTLQSGLLAAVVFFKVYHISVILFLCLLQGIANAFDTTSRQSLLVDMIDRKEDLPNAIALNSSMTNLTRLIGPAIAGIVLSTLGEDACFFLNFLSYFFVIYSLKKMRLNLPAVLKKEENIWQALRDGYAYLRHTPDIASLIWLIGAYSLMVIPYTTLLPVFAKDVFKGGAAAFSWFESATGLGALVGSIYIAGLKSSRKMINVVIYSSLLFSVGVLLLSSASGLLPAILFSGVAGLGMMALTSAINTYIQTHVPDRMRGRALSYFIMAYQGIIPVGSLLIGALAGRFNVIGVTLAEGLFGVAATMGFVFWKKIMHRRKVKGRQLRVESLSAMTVTDRFESLS